MSTAQTFVDDATSLDSFNTTQAQDNYLSSQNFQVSLNQSGNTSVFISQVGANNSIYSNTASSSGEINYLQQGNRNEIFVSLDAKRLEQTVVQNGNNNSMLNFNSATLDFHKGEIIQDGNNQNLTWYGGNSISENLKVTMKGEGQSVIVRNFQ